MIRTRTAHTELAETVILQNILRLLTVLLVLSSLSGCAVSNKFGPYMGQVVDAETREPIEGAVVIMECSTLTGNPGGTYSHYADALEVMTDKNGEFQIELRVTTLRPGHLWDHPYLMIFKPGYGVFPGHRGASVDITIRNSSYIFPENTYVTITLPRLKTRKERVRNLGDIFLSSKIPPDKWKNLHRLKSIERVELGFKPYPIPK